jgi:hypothetical protein
MTASTETSGTETSGTETSGTVTSGTDASNRDHRAMIPIRAFRTPVRGHAFASPPPGTERPEPGVPAELTREPHNPADPLAVAVWASPVGGTRWRIGYLDRGVAARLAPRLDAGRRVRAQLDGWSTEPDGRWRRPLLLLLPEDEETVADAPSEAVGEDPAPRAVTPRPAPAPATGPVATLVPSRDRVEPATRAGEGAAATGEVPRIWGRPPGVRRRRVS